MSGSAVWCSAMKVALASYWEASTTATRAVQSSKPRPVVWYVVGDKELWKGLMRWQRGQSCYMAPAAGVPDRQADGWGVLPGLLRSGTEGCIM